MGPVEIVADDIARLDDDELRQVLAELIQAEVDAHGLPRSSIFLGGNQNASDGGIDARVEWSGFPENTEWFPRQFVAFQSKAETMPASKLKDELAPNGELRSVFQEIAKQRGAYIVFSTDNCSDGMHKTRVAEMKKSVSALPTGERIKLDFYDASRIARWVNCYFGVAVKVHDIVGRPIFGWRPFENWSAPTIPLTSEYIVDDTPRVQFVEGSSAQISILEGINRVRNLLKNSDSSVRLVGLSGVGKTRFAQALFDERVGENPLDPGLVVYGDIAQSPLTTATQMAEQLLHLGREVIMIADNCPSETHRAVSAITNRPNSRVHLLTLDFDLGPDQFDKTQILQLFQNSNDLIASLLIERVPQLSVLDRDRVVRFSDGNARVALTIASKSKEVDSLAHLTDRELIDRLFLSARGKTDEHLKRCAEVAALVYALHVEQEGNQEAEHPILAELAETTQLAMYRAIAELVELGVAQKRGTQRAVLPQALAIRLATQALEYLPTDFVLQQISEEKHERLFHSFLRRLSSLHSSPQAAAIARQFLSEGGRFAAIETLDQRGFSAFENLAPVAPDLALDDIERSIKGQNSAALKSVESTNRGRLIALCRNLAYEKHRFARAAIVLLELATAETEEGGSGQASENFFELFWICLSWTKAEPEQRFEFLDQLIADDDANNRKLAVKALGYALESTHFSSSHDPNFGTRPMSEEWRPTSPKEQSDWFNAALVRLTDLATSDTDIAEAARAEIAQEIRGLIRIGLIEDVSNAATRIHDSGFWCEGWKQLCQAMYFDRKHWPTTTQQIADNLEERIRPSSIQERFSAFVISEPWGYYPPQPNESDEEEIERNIAQSAQDVGREVVGTDQFKPTILRALCYDGSSNCSAFGQGIAEKTVGLNEAWFELKALAEQCQTSTLNPDLLTGFLYKIGETNSDLVEDWLDDALGSPALAHHIVNLSTSISLSKRSIRRLGRAALDDIVPPAKFHRLAGGRVTDPIPSDELVKFLKILLEKGEDGVSTVVTIFHMHLFGKRGQPKDSALIKFGQELLGDSRLYQLENIRGDGHELAEIGKVCLSGAGADDATRKTCDQLLSATRSKPFGRHRFRDLFKLIGETKPEIALEKFLENAESERLLGSALFGRTDDVSDRRKNGDVSDLNDKVDTLMKWVSRAPSERACQLARLVKYLDFDDRDNPIWSQIAKKLINIQAVGTDVLDEFFQRFNVGVGFGPWSSRFVLRRPLIVALLDHENVSVRSWAEKTLVNLDTYIANSRSEERRRDERFE